MIRYPHDTPTRLSETFQSQARNAWNAATLPAAAFGADVDGIAPPFWRAGRQATSVAPPPVGGLGGFIAQLQSWIAGMVESLQQTFARFAQATPDSPEQRFKSVTLGSTGDPHLAIDGTVAGADGLTTTTHHFDSMTSHVDLMHSNDFAGGYTVSTTVGTPDAKGVTTNDSARITLNGGNDTIAMAKDGSFQITAGGQAYTLTPGQSMQLDGGETVTRSQDGSLTVTDRTATGGSLATTLRAWNGGVDVTATGTDVDLGGDIVNGVANQPDAVAAQPEARFAAHRG